MNSLKAQNGFKKSTPSKRKRSPSPPFQGKKKSLKSLDSDNETKGLECTLVKKHEMVKHSGFSFSADKIEANNLENEMWVNKYKPKTLGKIINQNTPQSCANKLKNWLTNWHKNKNVKPVYNRFGSSNDTGMGMRAALLSGPPGIGKTTTAQLVVKECGFEFVEFNASDTRNKKSMDEQILTLLSNKSLDGFFHDRTNQTKMTAKHVLIMDEVDGMGGNADRGGIAELIQFIKKTQIPIICICNDRNNIKIRNLANYCFDLRFQRPRVEQIRSMILSICFKEGVKVNVDLINEIIEMSNYDIRQVIHYFSVFANQSNKSLNQVKNHKVIKDVTLGPFEAVKKVFTAGQEYDAMSFEERSNLFFNDYQMIPLFAWENYVHCRPTRSKNDRETLSLAAKSIDAICISDLIETQIRTNQSWHLLPAQAALATVAPGHYMNGHFGSQIQFPSFLGKISSTNKKDRLSQELKQHMNLKITGSKTDLNLDYVLPLRDKIIQPLIRNESDAINKAIQTLNHYCLLKDDLTSIIELSLWGNEKSPFDKIDTKTKSAFTRAYNKAGTQLPYASKDQIQKIGKEKKTLNLSDDENVDENYLEEEEDVLPQF